MLTIATYFKQLADLSMPVTNTKSRLQSLQPVAGDRDTLDIEKFICIF